jgi:hypothetical protein
MSNCFFLYHRYVHNATPLATSVNNLFSYTYKSINRQHR